MQKSEKFKMGGVLVELNVRNRNIIVKLNEKQTLSLEERLASFDSEKKGGEMMGAKPIRPEKF